MSRLLKVLFATAAGFVAGVLVAPKSGKETREDLKQKAGDMKADANTKLDRANKIAADSAEALKVAAKKAQKEAGGFAKSAEASGKVVGAEAVKLSQEAKERAVRIAKDAELAAKRVETSAKQEPRT